MVNKTRYRSSIYALLITLVFFNTFNFALQRKMHKVIPPEGLAMNVECIAIAISDLKYGLKGYAAYYKVILDLHRNGILEYDGILPSRYNKGSGIDEYAQKANAAIKNALNIKGVEENGEHYLLREYKGLVDYYKTSFRLFGYNIGGFCYLYFLILGISVVTFFVSFYKRIDLLQFLLLFLCAHFVTVALGLQVIHNQRFLAVLSVLPALHIAFLILGKNVGKKGMFIGAIIQAFILFFSIHIRGSAMYQVMFLPFLYFLAVGYFYIRNIQIGEMVLKKVRCWPVIIVFLGLFLLKMHLVTSMDYPYTDTTSKHLFWHTLYLGMGFHPDSMSKYGIYCNDNLGFAASEKFSPGSIGPNFDIDYDLSESVMKKECLRIITTDPLFYIQSILYKIPQFLNLLFAPDIGYMYCFFNLINILVMLIGTLFCYDVFLKQAYFLAILALLELAFSSIPFLLASPMLILTSEPILILTFLMYILLSLFVCAIYKSLSRLKILKRNLVI